MEEGKGKRKGYDEVAGDVSGKKLRTPENADVNGKAQEDQEQEEDNMMAWLKLDEETAEELSKLLEVDGASPPPFKVRFMNDPYTSPVPFQSSSGFVTINGNEESCGSSFSESESSVMASVDMGGMKRKVFGEASEWFTEGSGGAWLLPAEEARRVVEDFGDTEEFFVRASEGLDCFDCCDHRNDVDNDDAMWVNFLGEDLFGAQ